MRFRSLIALIALAILTNGSLLESSLREYPLHECRLHSQLTRPVLALELVHDAGELNMLLARGDPGKDAIASMFARNTSLDRPFIFLYVSLFVLFLVLIAGRRRGPWRLLMWLGIAAAVIAGIADWIEDNGIVAALGAGTITDAHADAIRWPALIKWGLLGASCVAIGIILLFDRRNSPLGLTGSALLSLVLLAGVATALLSPWYPPAMETATTILFVPMLLVCLLFPFIRPKAETGDHSRGV